MEACSAALLCHLVPLMWSALAERGTSVNAEMNQSFQLSARLTELLVPDVCLAQVSQQLISINEWMMSSYKFLI